LIRPLLRNLSSARKRARNIRDGASPPRKAQQNMCGGRAKLRRRPPRLAFSCRLQLCPGAANLSCCASLPTHKAGAYVQADEASRSRVAVYQPNL